MSMYVEPNFKTEKALKEAVANGDEVHYWQPGPFGGSEPSDGMITIEGPHYPAAHTWYAQAKVEGGKIVSVK